MFCISYMLKWQYFGYTRSKIILVSWFHLFQCGTETFLITHVTHIIPVGQRCFRTQYKVQARDTDDRYHLLVTKGPQFGRACWDSNHEAISRALSAFSEAGNLEAFFFFAGMGHMTGSKNEPPPKLRGSGIYL